jgi:hypothetical protein
MRHAARVDTNQALIVDALRRAGASVQVLSAVGAGVPDLLVGCVDRRAGSPSYGHAINLLMEVKNPWVTPSHRKLTSDEQRWHAAWRGAVVVVATVHEALAAIGAIE